MKRVRDISTVLAALCLIAIVIQLYLANRHCQFRDGDTAWIASEENRTRRDPCALDRKTSQFENVIDGLFAFALLTALTTAFGHEIAKRRALPAVEHDH
jgi:hypothetical protein